MRQDIPRYMFFAEICMPHAIQIRQTGGPEVLHWTPIDVGDPGPGPHDDRGGRAAAWGPR
jgi:hypothetical protein